MNLKVIALYVTDQVLSLIAVGVALFWSAGRLDWGAAWAVLAIWFTWFLVTDVLLIRINPALMAERLSPPKDSKSWDKTIMSIFRLMTLARYILAGLDQRFGWTGGFPLALQFGAGVVAVLSYGLLGWAMLSNTFFSQVVRIQTDRGHTVIARGPYRFVRHPAYTGMILFEFGISTLLGSWWAIFAALICAVLLLLRTTLEDRTLQAELPGYQEYASKVRQRLLPGIW